MNRGSKYEDRKKESICNNTNKEGQDEGRACMMGSRTSSHDRGIHSVCIP